MISRRRIISLFEAHFHALPRFLVRAPGRVNLIGEHTDYNEGVVLPIAISPSLWIAFRPRGDETVMLYSAHFEEDFSFSTKRIPREGRGWRSYVAGVAAEARAAGIRLHGWEGVLVSEIPVGAGLSSSAALEMAVLRVFAALAGEVWDAARMADIGRRAEHEWAGVQCGVMDQRIVAGARRGHALFLDTRSLRSQYVPFPDSARIVVLDTGARRALASSAYNRRREECRLAAKALGVETLRDARMETLLRRRESMESLLFRRARHVLTENARVRRAVAAMQAGNIRGLGALFDESHASLRVDFEVSCASLDEAVSLARAQSGCLGARMTGAGFGGAAIALVEAAHAETFLHAMRAAFSKSERLSRAKAFLVFPEDGVSLISL